MPRYQKAFMSTCPFFCPLSGIQICNMDFHFFQHHRKVVHCTLGLLSRNMMEKFSLASPGSLFRTIFPPFRVLTFFLISRFSASQGYPCHRGKDNNFFAVKCQEVFVVVKSLSCVQLFAAPWTTAHQVPVSMGFSRHEYCSGLPFPSPRDLPNSGIEPTSLAYPGLQVSSSSLSHWVPGSISRNMGI